MDSRSSGSYPEGQSRRGHLHGTSKNTVNKSGRPDGQGRLQPGAGLSVEGYPERDSTNQVAKTGRPVPSQGNVRGYAGNVSNVGTHGVTTRKANGGVGGLDRTAP